MRSSNKKIIIEIIVALLVLLFLYTALSKLLDFKGFVYDMNHQPLSAALTALLIWLIPATEIGIVISLLVPKWRYMGLWASLMLMSTFTVYVAMILMHRFSYIPCSCGGAIKYLTWIQHLILNFFYLIISIVGISISQPLKRRKSIAI